MLSKQDAEYLFIIILWIVAAALLVYSFILAVDKQWSAATYFLVAAYAIAPYRKL